MKNNIKNYLPEDYQDAEILIRKVQNINRTYTGLNVHKKDQVYAACISLEDLYELLDHGRTMEGLYWEVSRIVPVFEPGTTVTTTRTDVHYIVTEYGVANLRAKSLRERARLLINIAHPKFRDQLWEAYYERYGKEDQ